MFKILRKIRRLFEIKRTLHIGWLVGSANWARICGKKIVLFQISYRGQEAYIAPVIRELESRRGKACLFLFIDNRLLTEVAAVSAAAAISQSKTVNLDLLRFIGAIDTFITPTQWADCPASAPLRICIFHGQPTKGNTFVPELMVNFNTLFILGPLQRSLYEEFAAVHPEIASRIKTFNVGYPKSDALINGHHKRSATLGELGLSPGKPVVLFAPAYDLRTSLDLYGESVIEEMLKSEANVIVKLHPMHYNPPYLPSGVNWPDRLRRFEQHVRFRQVGNLPLDAFLEASDVLVTDVSGASFEFMMLDKPVVFIDCPSFFDVTLGRGDYVRPGEDVMKDIRANAGRSAGVIVSHPSQLPVAIQRSLEFPQEFSPQRQAVRSQLLYNPGHAAKAAVDTLLHLLNKSEDNLMEAGSGG